MSADRLLFVRLATLRDRIPVFGCRSCGKRIDGRMNAVWHAKKHEARGEASDVPGARCFQPVEERYQLAARASLSQGSEKP